MEWIIAGKDKIIRNSLETTTIADAYDRVVPHLKEDRISNDRKEGEQPQSEDTGMKDQKTHDQVDSDTPAFAPHRDVYFYLHRPRTSTKQPVVVPLFPNANFTEALRGRAVLEFPSIYVLPDSPESLLAINANSKFLLEESGVFHKESESGQMVGGKALGNLGEENSGSENGSGANLVDIENVDENKILEVLKQDLRDTGTASEAA